MSDQSRDSLDFPTRRWLLWGGIAIVALAAVVIFFIWFGNTPGETPPSSAPTADQMEWSIELVDITGDTVTLKGDLPLGFPTETWQNDFQIARSVGETFQWDLDLELPVTVVAIDGAGDCDNLNGLLADILSEGGAAAEPGLWQAYAFAQHAVDTMREQGCTIDEDALEGTLSP
jgi:hypothetical protein